MFQSIGQICLVLGFGILWLFFGIEIFKNAGENFADKPADERRCSLLFTLPFGNAIWGSVLICWEESHILELLGNINIITIILWFCFFSLVMIASGTIIGEYIFFKVLYCQDKKAVKK